jgi:soluble cytochrome b562
MEAMNKAIRTLNKTIADASKKEASLAAVYDLQLHTVACKKEIPKTAATQPADKKDAFIAGYRKGMNDVLKVELELEEQVAAGDTAKAQATVKKLRDMEKAGHSVYQPPEEK